MGRRTDPYTFLPFGGGVRHCLGAAFATYEAKIVFARVLSRVILRPDPDYAARVSCGVVWHSALPPACR